MRLFRLLERKLQSKGHGVHSPFAFEVITNVLNSPYSYYVFTEIPEQSYFNRLSFRLVNYFKAESILEINPGNELNSRFIYAASSKIKCESVKLDFHRNESKLLELLGDSNESILGYEILEKFNERKFDAIFINLQEYCNEWFVKSETCKKSLLESLIKLSHENSFWVINPINTKQTKQFWRAIVNDKRISVTFDIKDTGVVFLRFMYYKQHYYI